MIYLEKTTDLSSLAPDDGSLPESQTLVKTSSLRLPDSNASQSPPQIFPQSVSRTSIVAIAKYW